MKSAEPMAKLPLMARQHLNYLCYNLTPCAHTPLHSIEGKEYDIAKIPEHVILPTVSKWNFWKAEFTGYRWMVRSDRPVRDPGSCSHKNCVFFFFFGNFGIKHL